MQFILTFKVTKNTKKSNCDDHVSSFYDIQQLDFI